MGLVTVYGPAERMSVYAVSQLDDRFQGEITQGEKIVSPKAFRAMRAWDTGA